MNYSLQRRMLLALSLSAVAVILVTSLVSAVVAYPEAGEEQDEQLQMATALAARSPAQPTEIDDEDEPDEALFLAAPGTLIHPNDQSKELLLPVDVAEGFSTVELADQRYRVYTTQRPDGMGRISALQKYQVRRNETLRSIATAVLPLLLAIILIWLVFRALIRRTFESIGGLGRQLVSTAAPVSSRHTVPIELLPFIEEVETAWQRLHLLLDGRARFVSNVAHELRSPLAAVSLQMDNLASVELSAEARARLDLVRGGLRRTSLLLQQLLDLGAIQQGGSEVSAIIDVPSVLRQAIELVLPYANSRQIDLEVDRLDAVRLKGSSTALLMLLRNALDNAVRYSPIDSVVEISVVQSDQHMVLQVADQGDGMDPEDMARAFEPFFRSSRTHDESGSGLGLAIVAEAAILLGGTARLKARAQKGLTFEYRQPLDQTDADTSLLPLPLSS
jgi:two-component system OmpR family sensor kinase